MKSEQKQLGFLDIFSLGISGAIGSGIFIMLGMGIESTGRSIVIAVSAGCFFMLFAYLYHLIMSSIAIFPGGDYSMQALAFNNPVLVGIVACFKIIANAALAMYGLAMVDYASMVFPGLADYRQIVAVLILTLMFLSTIKGSKFVATLTTLMTVILIGSIAVFICLGLPNVEPGFFDANNGTDNFLLNGGAGLFLAFSTMSFACQGTTMAPISMMKVTKNARRTIPIAILFITVGLAIIYGLMSIVAAGVLPISEVAGQNLSAVASVIMPRWAWVIFILGGAVFAIATSALGAIAMIRYPMMQVADDGWLPEVFKKQTKDGYPWVIQLMFYLITVVPIFLNISFDALVSLSMVPSMLICMYMNLYLMKMVKQFPKQWRSSVLYMPYPVLCVISIIAVLCNGLLTYNLMAMLSPAEAWMIVGLLLACVVVSIIRIKTKAVDLEKLQRNKEEMFNSVLNEESNSNDKNNTKNEPPVKNRLRKA